MESTERVEKQPTLDDQVITQQEVEASQNSNQNDNVKQKSEETMLENKSQEATVEEKATLDDKSPIEGKSEDAKVDDQSQDVIVEDKSQDAIVKDKSEDAIVEDKSEDAIVEDKSEDAIVEDKPEDTTVEDKSQDATVVDNLEDASVKDKSQDAIVESKSTDASIEDKSEDATVEDKSEDATVEDKSEDATVEDKSKEATVEDKSKVAIVEDASEEAIVEDKSKEATLEVEPDKSEDVQETSEPSQLESITIQSSPLEKPSDLDENSPEIDSSIASTNAESLEMDGIVTSTNQNSSSSQEDTTNDGVTQSTQSTQSTTSESQEKMDIDEDTNKADVSFKLPDISMEVVDATSEKDSPKTNSDDSSQPLESSSTLNDLQTAGESNSENSVKDVNDTFVNNTTPDEESGKNENTEFVHVNSESEKEPGDKTQDKNDTQEIQDEEDFQSSQPQEDPIASDKDFQSGQPQEDPIASDNFESILEEENEDSEQVGDEEQGSSEELCIIPDTERVISQEEKDAATSMMPLREATNTDSSTVNNSTQSSEESAPEPTESSVEKFTVNLCLDKTIYTCMQCLLLRKPKYVVQLEVADKSLYVCDDNCLKDLKEQHGDNVTHTVEGDLRVKNLTSGVNNDNMVSTVNYVRKCGNCMKLIKNSKSALSWETMEYCNETCLAKYQKRTGSVCTNCQEEVKNNCLGKYCVRFGHDIRQFCGSSCLEEYKKGLKVCSYCQKDISGGADGFLAPVKGQFKDFCTKECMEKYDITNCNFNKLRNVSGKCSVCSNQKPITIEFEHGDKLNLFCGDPCFVAFKFVNNITPGKCDQCQKYVDNKILEQNSMFYGDLQHSFCSKTCQNIYVIGNRKIVICKWCKVKKYNFDMIRRVQGNDHFPLCSLNCFNFYKVSLNAAKNKKVDCDQCSKNTQPRYHLTMSDATIRNFCSHSCVMQFQNQFPKSPITFNESEEVNATPIPTGGPRKNKIPEQETQTVSSPVESPTIPVISSVQSLAITNGPTAARTTRSKANNFDKPSKTQIKQQVIIRSLPIPPQRNMATMCKVVTANKCINCKPFTANKEVQTDEIPSKTAIIPIPIPIYVPAPVCMYSLPFPVPFPFALPIPVPIFIPTTRNSATGIMKEIKKIQVKIPTNPFEAELLMMAEMVAGDKKEEHTDSESEEEEPPAPVDETPYTAEPVDTSNTFGDDMLQMALKMATELEEPAVDLEGALTANTITASQTGEPAGVEESVDDPQPIHHLMDRQPTVRGRKRPGRPPRSGSVSKRGRRSSNQLDIPLMAPPQPPALSEPVEKPDANMCLKFTFGVNAWKQWVTTKNAELEKTSRRVKLFKPEILQLTADELNYSLCLFVKEVRKPNGQEYAPDTIYYLCLGIQQYLFENGRIDNIFCDTYYEKFTDCLDDVARKFSVLYNDSHYIVTRVEEEHLWESKQLGAHSPHVLLSTLMFFNTKHFNLTTVDEHMQLSFSHIMKHWKRNPNQPGTNKVAGSRNVLLRFYPPQTPNDAGPRKKKVYEQQENEENPLRCPVKLYEFYLSKCPESVKTRNDVFYLLPERSCVPDSPVWYSTMALPRNALEKMLHRVKMVKEINVALLTS